MIRRTVPIAFPIALSLILCLILAGCSQSASTAADSASVETAEDAVSVETTETAASGKTEAAPESESESSLESVSESASEDELVSKPVSDASETEYGQDGEFFTLDGMEIQGMGPFYNGIGWVQYYEGAEMYTAAVEADGHVLFKMSGPVWYVSPFEDGAAFMVVSDNAAHFTEDSYIYEQKQDSGWHEVIVDTAGNELYSTALIETATGSEEEHILCAGDGKFVVMRHSSGLQRNEWTLGTIDRNGNVIDEFSSFSIAVPQSGSMQRELDEKQLPNWKNSRTLPNYYYYREDAGEFAGNGFSRYLGDGVFFLPGITGSGASSILYQPEKKLAVPLAGELLMSDVFEGKVISMQNTTYYLQDVNSTDAETADVLKETEFTDFSYKDAAT